MFSTSNNGEFPDETSHRQLEETKLVPEMASKITRERSYAVVGGRTESISPLFRPRDRRLFNVDAEGDELRFFRRLAITRVSHTRRDEDDDERERGRERARREDESRWSECTRSHRRWDGAPKCLISASGGSEALRRRDQSARPRANGVSAHRELPFPRVYRPQFVRERSRSVISYASRRVLTTSSLRL